MSPLNISQALETRKSGQFATIFISRKAHLRKEFSHVNLIKNSRVQIQLAAYANRAPVREAIENGTRDAPVLPKHISHVETIGHIRFWKGHNGKTYLPYPLNTGNEQVEYLLDGKPVSPESIKSLCLASEFPNRPSKESLADRGQVPFIGVTVEHIVEIR